MSDFAQMFNDDLAHAEGDMPQTVTISGTGYAAVCTDVQRGEGLEVEGVMLDQSLSVIMRTEILPAPAIASLLTYNGRQYRVLRVRDCADGVSYELTCDSVQK